MTKKILVSGFINTNVLDGSAIFMSSLTQVLAMHPQAQIEVLLAVPNERDIVLGDIERLNNVKIIDPFSDERFSQFEYLKHNKLTKPQYGELIHVIDQMEHYEAIFIRSLEVVEYLLQQQPQIAHKLFAYITGVTVSTQQLDEQLIALLTQITSNQGYLLCQTEEMKQHILSQTSIQQDRIIDLNPMIPNQQESFEALFVKKDKYDTFCYTGKFAYEWNIIDMIAQFREITELYPDAKLYIAGDQFKQSPKYEQFVPYARYLIENSKNVYWVGGLARQDTLNLINACDVGLTYRHDDLNDSLELSTKLLEYCSLGVPPVLNRTPMHERIFGHDYPYFANNNAEFYQVMEQVILNPEQYEATAKHVYDVATHYSFTATFNRLLPFLPFEVEQEFILISQVSRQKPVYIDKTDNKAAVYLTQQYMNSIKDIIAHYSIVDVKVVGEKAVFTLSDQASDTTQLLDILQQVEAAKPKTQAKSKTGFSIHQVQKQYNKVDINVDKLVKENRRLRKDLKRIRTKYNNLANSKLGSIQKKYWKYRSK
ncbi:glycosyltransferase [Macrococcus capreoli]|uniref:glycosyltransferase n=1 Tax=Macrococcus capreoli TaxID=2982690 RepID=UPI003EE77490